jgi:cytidylate kinase
MSMKNRSLQQIVEEQVQRWQLLKKKDPEKQAIPTITVSREPGSGGRLIAEALAAELGFDIFHQEMILQLSDSAKVQQRILETLDEKGMNVLEEWISSLVNKRHLWPDQYLKHLMKLVGVIGRHGGAVIVGRGANFMLPPDRCLKLRIIAPRRIRIENVVRLHEVTPQEAERRVIRAESERRAFVRKYFNADINDPLNYDMVLNTGRLDVKTAVCAIRGVLGK